MPKTVILHQQQHEAKINMCPLCAVYVVYCNCCSLSVCLDCGNKSEPLPACAHVGSMQLVDLQLQATAQEQHRCSLLCTILAEVELCLKADRLSLGSGIVVAFSYQVVLQYQQQEQR